MKKHFIHLLFTIVPYLIFAQRQYLDATITTNNGQKIVGKIAAENWLTTPRSIDFQTENGDTKTYYVADLSGFEAIRHDGGKLMFSRFEDSIEVSPTAFAKLDLTPAFHFQKDTSWHQLIYRGVWSLYSMVDKTGKSHYFIETDNLKSKELVGKPWLKQIGDRQRVERVDLFRKQLYDLAQGCPEALNLASSNKLV